MQGVCEAGSMGPKLTIWSVMSLLVAALGAGLHLAERQRMHCAKKHLPAHLPSI